MNDDEDEDVKEEDDNNNAELIAGKDQTNTQEVSMNGDDGNYEMKASDIFIFGSKLYAITKLEAKKQLQVRTEKDPRDYIGITVDPEDVHPVADGYFVGYSNHTTVVLGWDPEKHTVRRFHHCYIDEFDTRINERKF